MPQAIDHANAKEKRFLSWAEKISYVRRIKMELRWIAGSTNDFADLLSRLAEQIGKAVRDREMMPLFHPMTRMTKIGEDGKEFPNKITDHWNSTSDARQSYPVDNSYGVQATMWESYRYFDGPRVHYFDLKSSRGNQDCKVFMRFTVLLFDILVWFSAAIYYCQVVLACEGVSDFLD